MPQMVLNPPSGLSLCSQRCSSPEFPFFSLDVTDVLGSFEGCDGRAVVEVSPIAREFLPLQHGYLDPHEATFLFCIFSPLVGSFIWSCDYCSSAGGGTCLPSGLLPHSGSNEFLHYDWNVKCYLLR